MLRKVFWNTESNEFKPASLRTYHTTLPQLISRIKTLNHSFSILRMVKRKSIGAVAQRGWLNSEGQHQHLHSVIYGTYGK